LQRVNALRPLRLLAICVLLGALLYWALRNAPLAALLNALRQLHIWQIALLLGIDALVIVLISTRWWLIARADSPSLPLSRLIGYRLSVFAVSYFTPGPQVGGEPLQIIYLRRYHGLSFARAASSVLIDKLLEITGNFLLIGIGLVALLRAGLVTMGTVISTAGWVVMAALLAWPPIYTLLLYCGLHPIRAALRALLANYDKQKWYRLIVASEVLAARFTHRHPRALSGALVTSLLAWTGMALEYLLMLQFLNVDLNLWQALAGLTASLLAFLMPLPGGLGALEASQVLALGAFGYPATSAISLTLLMRARDLVNGGLGVVLAGRGFSRDHESAATPASTGSSPS